MWSRLFLISLSGMLSSQPLHADSSAEAVQLQLRQHFDVNCDGTPENNAVPIPNTCVIYEIEARNTGKVAYKNLQISASIPEHTVLIHPYRHLHSDEPIESVTVQDQENTNDGHNSRLLQTRLDTLQPGQDNKVILRYTVKIL